MTVKEINSQIDFLKMQREELQNQAKALTKQIVNLQRRIRHKECYEPRPKHTNTIVYQTFGKHYKDLTADEKRKYDAMMQRERRKRKLEELK